MNALNASIYFFFRVILSVVRTFGLDVAITSGFNLHLYVLLPEILIEIHVLHGEVLHSNHLDRTYTTFIKEDLGKLINIPGTRLIYLDTAQQRLDSELQLTRTMP